MKFQKITAFLILIFFTVPIATAFCCCTDFSSNQSRQETMSHGHGNHDHGNHHHGSEQGDKGSSGSCECGNEIIANVANRTTIDFSAINTYFSKLQNDPAFQLLAGSILQANHGLISFHDTGPPGISSTSTPLYLRLSVLRI